MDVFGPAPDGYSSFDEWHKDNEKDCPVCNPPVEEMEVPC